MLIRRFRVSCAFQPRAFHHLLSPFNKKRQIVGHHARSPLAFGTVKDVFSRGHRNGIILKNQLLAGEGGNVHNTNAKFDPPTSEIALSKYFDTMKV